MVATQKVLQVLTSTFYIKRCDQESIIDFIKELHTMLQAKKEAHAPCYLEDMVIKDMSRLEEVATMISGKEVTVEGGRQVGCVRFGEGPLVNKCEAFVAARSLFLVSPDQQVRTSPVVHAAVGNF